MLDIETLYAQQIRELPAQARLQLLALIAQDLASPSWGKQHRISELQGLGKEMWQGIDPQEYVNQLRGKQHRISELQGLGKEMWQGIDPQEYVNQLRREWDERP